LTRFIKHKYAHDFMILTYARRTRRLKIQQQLSPTGQKDESRSSRRSSSLEYISMISNIAWLDPVGGLPIDIEVHLYSVSHGYHLLVTL